jgi:hypothetical protein
MRLSKQGFTLAELLLAAAISTFALSGILFLFINCYFLNEANRNLSIAMSHAQYIMEDIKNETTLQNIRDRITNGDWNLDATEINAEGLQAMRGESITTCCCSAACQEASPCLVSCPATDPLGIYLRVSWQDRNQRARSTELRTLGTVY